MGRLILLSAVLFGSVAIISGVWTGNHQVVIQQVWDAAARLYPGKPAGPKQTVNSAKFQRPPSRFSAAGAASAHVQSAPATYSSVAPMCQGTCSVDSSRQLNLTLWWFAPFFSGGGYSSEAIAFALGLHSSPAIKPDALWITQHGDAIKRGVLQSLEPTALEVLVRMLGLPRHEHISSPSIVVCHSEPGAWSVPQPLFQTSACPPHDAGIPPGSIYTIGRTMFETDRLTAEHASRCNKMDEVWVPTEFHKGVFAASGVALEKLVVVPEPVDSVFFDPSKASPLPLPQGQLVFGTEQAVDTKADHAFISMFKWEERKAWSELLAAFLEEFGSSESVSLTLLTHPYHGQADFASQMHAWATQTLGVPGEAERRQLPRVWVVTRHLSQAELRGLYAAADAFVLPSRGEGWGRPHVEAMSMALPVIATNWSGPTAYMDDSCSYPLQITGLTPIERGPFAGHQWAAPSVTHLKQLMRRVVEHPAEAREKGRLAREKMVREYAPDVVAKSVAEELFRIERQLAAVTATTTAAATAA